MLAPSIRNALIAVSPRFPALAPAQRAPLASTRGGPAWMPGRFHPHHTAALTSAGQHFRAILRKIRQLGQQYCPNAPCQILSAETRVSLTLIWSSLAISGRGVEAGAGTKGARAAIVSCQLVRSAGILPLGSTQTGPWSGQTH